MTKQEEALLRINRELETGLRIIDQIGRKQVRRGQTNIESNLEEELGRRRLTPNESE